MVKGKTHLHKYKTIGSRYQGRFPPLRLWKWKIDGNETDLCVYFNQLEQRCSTGRNSRKFKTVAQLLFLFTAICCAVSMISIYTVLTAKKIRSKEVRTNKHRKKKHSETCLGYGHLFPLLISIQHVSCPGFRPGHVNAIYYHNTLKGKHGRRVSTRRRKTVKRKTKEKENKQTCIVCVTSLPFFHIFFYSKQVDDHPLIV